MQKQILPINAYIINDLDHTIKDIFTGNFMFGGISGADVYHGGGGDHYYNALLTEDMKAKVVTALNQVYSSDTSDTMYFAFSNGVFHWSAGDAVWVSGEGEGSAKLNYGGNYADGVASVAYGNGNRASGIGSHAEGNLTNAKGNYSHTEGYNADASGLYSHAEGEYCKAWGQDSHAEGYYTLAFGSDSHAEGHNNGMDSRTVGKFTGAAGATTYTVTSSFKSPDLYDLVHYRAKNTYARVLNVQRVSNSSNTYTVVLDKTLDASSAMNASVYRISHIAYGPSSHAEGMTTKSPGQGSHAEGAEAISAAYASHAEGNYTQAKGQYSHAEGQETMTLGEKSHSEGFSTFAFGLAAHTEGLGVSTSAMDKKYIVRITGDVSTTSYTTSASHNLKPGDLLSYNPVGYIPSNIRKIAKVLTTPTATSFTVDNTLNSLIAFSDTSVVKLKGIATAMASHAEGYYTKATGVGSHSEGYDTRTDSSYSHAEGESTDASGIGSHTEGYYTNTFANYSHAEGRYTRTSNVYEHAQGTYNMSHSYNTSFGNSGNTLNSIGIGVSDASRSNAVEVMQNGDVYVKGVGSYDGSNYVNASTLQEVVNSGGGGSADLMTSITYSALKTLRDTSALIPGMQYRVTNYECTTTQADTSVAGNVFDIIVTADSSTELNENARAAHHEGDTYFQTSDLNAWELKYCLDNDADRFAWADAINGKGVIYYMKDEWSNECPYDFKNIMFKRKLTNGALDDQGTDTWCYTFNGYNVNESEYYDISSHMFYISGQTRQDAIDDGDGADECDMCYNNVILPVKYTYREYYDVKVILNNIVFLSVSYDNGYDNGYDVAHCYGNAFSENCHDNTFSENCHDNTFGENCYNNTFGKNCYGNTFGKNCYGNTFGDYCNNNSFGNTCRVNLLGNSCYSNSFGNDCYSNSFGNGCSGNLFGNGCNNNSFMEGCDDNSFRNGCNNNSLGNSCYHNSFGNFCHRNSFGNLCQAITVFDNVFNCSITGGSYSAPVKNAQILNGTRGSTSSNKLTITFTADQNYTQIAGLNSSGVLKIWTPADLID